jgi:arabinan endo-1,5-alpha-L-arabinosidase
MFGHLGTLKKATIFWLIALSAPSVFSAVLTGSFGSHDPSRITKCDGVYYVYSTGGRMMYSTDMVAWATGTSPFQQPGLSTIELPSPSPLPSAAPSASPGGQGPQGPRRQFWHRVPDSMGKIIPKNQGIWAPDVIYINKAYYLYYSVADASGTQTGIGLLTSPTLNPGAADYHWTDRGVVLLTYDHEIHISAIDPCPFLDADGKLWMSYGSGYANGAKVTDPTIYIMKLDDTTGLASTSNTQHYPVAPGHIEASYVMFHNGYYYAFWNSGGCCAGNKSTYTIHMARSRTASGPYIDKKAESGTSDVLVGPVVTQDTAVGTEHGPGQIGIYEEGGVYYCTYHYYPETGRGASLGLEKLTWGADGWPVCSFDSAGAGAGK